MKYTIRTIVSATVALVFGMSAMAQTADQYIYFDLAAGGVTINASTYSGKVYVNGTATTVSGTHSASNKYYVYQSSSIAGSPGLASETGYETQDDFNQRQNIRIPQYANVRYDGKNWDEYVKNNTTDPNIVCDNWDASAAQVLRSSTGNQIKISGKNLVCDITIDNLWSSYCPESEDDYCQGGIKIGTNNTEQVTIRLKNYSKFFNVFYHRNSGKSGFLKFTSSDGDNSTNGSLTVIQTTKEWKNNDREHSLIGGYYGSSTEGKSSDEYSNSYGMFFNGGSIYAGKAEIENSIWSDKVNNDQDGAIGGGATGAGEITINGGVITSVCHTTSAAIGGGAAMSLQGGKGIVTINGGEVYAYGYGVYVSGSGSKAIVPVSAIGGGSTRGRTDNRGGDAEVTINGGYVYAQSIGGTAIGGGNDGVGSGGNAKVTITGGTIEAKSLSGKISDFDVEVSNAVGGGTGGVTSGKPGGNVEMIISGSPTITVGSIGGGKTNNKKGKIGTAQIDISGNPLISGQFILAAGAGTAPKFTMTSGTICNSSTFDTQFSKVQANGGAVYIEDGTVTMSGGTISGCTALNGGAFYIQGGTFTTSGNSIISGNTATIDKDGNGGNGGGLYVEGGTVTFTSGRLTDNTAVNGGGLFLASGASMKFTGGIIKSNHAVAPEDYSGPYTAYAGTTGAKGFGGGFYIQKGVSTPSKLEINIASGADFGIYDNSASTGADDILAEGGNTSINIPNVKDMQLAEFAASAYPNWYEDYNAEDTHYTDGLNIHSGCTSFDRFVNMLNNTAHYAAHKYIADGSKYISNKYLNLKLGYESLKIIISAKGLNEKETAYYQLIYHDPNGDIFYPVLLPGNGSAIVSKSLVGMPWGKYSVISDKKWTWAYNVLSPNPEGKYENVTVVGVNEKEFPFEIEHISGDDNVLHDEDYKVNRMLDDAAIVPNVDVEPFQKKDDVHVRF